MIFNKFSKTVSAVAVLLLTAAAGFAQVPSSQHVILVIEENSRYVDVVADMPWLIAQGNANGYATNYKSDNGGSLLDYLWLASGSCHSSANCTLPPGTHDFNCSGNDCYYPGINLSDAITDHNIFRAMNNAGISWKVYAQSYALAGGTVTTPDNANGTSYYRRHNGATWYSDVLSNVNGSADKVVDFAQLAVDMATGQLPRFMIIVPDGNHDGHDCPVGYQQCTTAQKLAAVDDFLNITLSPILNLPDFQRGGDGVVFVTFDECGGGTDNGCGAAVYTAVIGPKVVPHTVSNMPYKHENTLRTILDSLNIAARPGAATAVNMFDFFVAQGKKPQVEIGSPANGAASVNSPVLLQASAIPSSGKTVSGWYVYVDGTAVYNTGAASTISSSLPMSNGRHTVMARAWDTSGAYGDQTISITVTPLRPTVSVSTPAYDANVGSPVNIIAFASPSPGHTISSWSIYSDGVRAYNASAQTMINAKVPLAPGPHNLLVRTWDTSGGYGDQALYVTGNSNPAVAVSAPLPNWNVISPIHIKASATPGSGHTISGWYVYLDGVPAYHAGAVNSIDANISAATGFHSAIVRAWDNTGAYGDQVLVLQVGQVAVNINTPANGAIVNSPVNIQAGASSSKSIVGWHVYVDSVDSYGQNYGGALNVNLSMKPGAHSIKARAWDSSGAYGDQTTIVTVQ